MSEQQTPWAAAAQKVGPSTDYIGLKAIIREACESFASDLRAENERLSQQLKRRCEDWAEDDTAIRNLCRPILGDAAVDGDSYRVPSIVDLVERLAKDRAALAAKVEQLRSVLGEISLFRLRALAAWCDRVDDERGYEGPREVQSDLRQWVNVIADALSDAPPPAVVPDPDL